MNVQFADSTQTTIVAYYAGPQPASVPNQGVVTVSDLRWAAYYATLTASIQQALPLPTTPLGPTLAQQAASALSAGLAITSTGTPALNGTYACNPAMQQNMASMYNLIQRAGGNAFPGGLTSLPWPVAGGTVTFNSVAEFLAMETAVGDYVMQLNLIITTNSGTLPPPTTTIS
jgi:hypothetical protein